MNITSTTTSAVIMAHSCCARTDDTEVHVSYGSSDPPQHCEVFETYMDLWTWLLRYFSIHFN